MSQETKPANPPAFPICCRCDFAAVIQQGRVFYCAKHYRFSTMRTGAKRNGKTVPSWDDLEFLVPAGMVCVGCRVVMKWRPMYDGPAGSLITLQHDRSGGHRLICLGCNTRHAKHPGDEFYDVPDAHKRCPDCAQVKPFDSFWIDRSRPIGRKAYCKECSYVRHAKWAGANREHVNTEQRRRRAEGRSARG